MFRYKYILFILVILINSSLIADKVNFELESGVVSFSRNDVRIPGDGGTKFDMLDLTKDGPSRYLRLYSTYEFNDLHSLRFTFAPLKVSGVGLLKESIVYQNEIFSSNTLTKGLYKFNNYRLTYRWNFYKSENSKWGTGVVAFIRDAEIYLEQGNKKQSKKDLGFVPLLHIYGLHKLHSNTSVVIDIEGAWSPMGRAIDAAVKAKYDLDSKWHICAGYRTIEGGADNEDVYTFSWLHYAMLQVGYGF